MKKKIVLTIAGLVILFSGLYSSYQVGFRNGEKAGFKAAYKEYEKESSIDDSKNKKKGVIYKVSDNEITIIDQNKEFGFSLSEDLEVLKKVDISPSEFDSVESDYLTKEEEYEEAKRQNELNDELEKEYNKLKKEYQNIVKAAESGEREISVNDLSKGQLVRLTLSDNNQVTKIKVIEN